MSHDPNQRLPPSSCACGSRACEEASTFTEVDLQLVRLDNRVRHLEEREQLLQQQLVEKDQIIAYLRNQLGVTP